MKVWNYVAIMLGMMIFLYFLGFDLGGDTILSGVGINLNNTNMSSSTVDVASSNWADKIFNPITGLIIGLSSAIIVGLFTKSFDWKIVMIGFFTSFIVLFLSFGNQIVQLAQSSGEDWLSGVVITVFGVLTGMFVFSIVEWFGGND